MRIKKALIRILPHRIFSFIKDIVYPEKIDVLEKRLNALFLTLYQGIADPSPNQKTAFRNAEFKIYSKHGCDGILLHLFSKIGTSTRVFIEMGVENGRECNTANLSLNFGWNGLLIDANDEWIQSAKLYYKRKLGKESHKVKIVPSFVTVENINNTLAESKIQGEIDLLSIDIDGNDYWVWKSITTVRPRVVVMEYNAAFGLRSLTIPYDSQFQYQSRYRDHPLYFGASLSALVKLSKEKGYILVACDSHGHDAFFVREDVAKGKLVELSVEEAFYPNPYNVEKFGDIDAQFERVKEFDFKQV